MPTKSIHDHSPGTKLFVLIVLMVSAFVASPYLGSPLIFLYLGYLYSQSTVSLSGTFAAIGKYWIVILLLGLFQTLFVVVDDSTTIWYHWAFIEFSTYDINLFCHFVFRLINVLFLFRLFTRVLDTADLSHAVQEILYPLEKKGLPTHTVGLIITLTFRFIPLLAEELDRLTMAQKARGTDLGKKKGFLQNITGRFPLIIPLFINALERSEHLIEAMEARGYDTSGKRTRLRVIAKCPADYRWMFNTTILLILLILIKIFSVEGKLGVLFYEQIKQWT
ncbi:energy-coupling factor transporter transmembrane component T family protein [Spirochaeta cellobiosiphila]|uniref:energy-coupling factor transporter transmembrane component T family protein n=1 Tax=Spirochaeta cellobiosiphila TaxID=504483 RepID=UPI000400C6E8|nr:energy-coupling factor transporter transmembrane component T [Spirochaeta cellobiosiphila]